MTHETPQPLEDLLQQLVEAYSEFGEVSWTFLGPVGYPACVSITSMVGGEGWTLTMHPFRPVFEESVEPETWVGLVLRLGDPTLGDPTRAFNHVRHFLGDYDSTSISPVEREEALAIIVAANTVLGGHIVMHEGVRYRILPLDLPTLVWGGQERLRRLGFTSLPVSPYYKSWQHDHCDLWWYPLNGSETHEGGLRVRRVGTDLVRELETVAGALEILTHPYVWLPWRSMPGERQNVTTWTPGTEQLQMYLTKQRERAMEARRIRPWR